MQYDLQRQPGKPLCHQGVNMAWNTQRRPTEKPRHKPLRYEKELNVTRYLFKLLFSE